MSSPSHTAAPSLPRGDGSQTRCWGSAEQRILLGIVLLVGAVSVVAGQSAKARRISVEQEIINLEKKWSEAYLKKDVAALKGILADDIIIIYGDGTKATKAEDIAGIGSDEQIESNKLDDFRVKVYGDTAVVVSRLTSSGVRDGKKFTAQFRYIDVYRKQNGRWQCVITQNTRIGKIEL